MAEMNLVLNSFQAKSLSGFFMDVAKGLVLGGLGFTAALPIEFKSMAVLLTGLLTFIFVQIALKLLEGLEK